jgi:hypothetical protein
MTHAAGILIVTDDTPTFLLGYTPKIAAWSGFGGKIEGAETPWECAVRETFEELFGCCAPAGAAAALRHSGPLQDGDNGAPAPYLTYVVDLADILAVGPLESPYYSTFPRDAAAVCRERTACGAEGQEITEIRVVTAKEILQSLCGVEVAPDYVEDIAAFMQK